MTEPATDEQIAKCKLQRVFHGIEGQLIARIEAEKDIAAGFKAAAQQQKKFADAEKARADEESEAGWKQRERAEAQVDRIAELEREIRWALERIAALEAQLEAIGAKESQGEDWTPYVELVVELTEAQKRIEHEIAGCDEQERVGIDTGQEDKAQVWRCVRSVLKRCLLRNPDEEGEVSDD